MTKLLLLADDSKVIRESVRELLARNKEWEICSEAVDGAQAVEQAKIAAPDLAILDIAMPRLNGIDAGRQILKFCPATIVLAISMHDLNLMITHLKSAGIKGFVSKSNLGAELVPAIKALLHGDTYFNKAAAQTAGH